MATLGVDRIEAMADKVFKIEDVQACEKAIGGDVRSIRLLLRATQDFGMVEANLRNRSFAIRFVRPGEVAKEDLS